MWSADPALSRSGRRADCGRSFPAEARIVASPLRRAQDLARRLGDPETDARLVEMDFGAWEKRRWDDLPRDEIDAWAADFTGYAPPGGESVGAMAARTVDWWELGLAQRWPRIRASTGGGRAWRTVAGFGRASDRRAAGAFGAVRDRMGRAGALADYAGVHSATRLEYLLTLRPVDRCLLG